ncbi:hypothetical protein [Shewanella hanedai]|uniref:hypothetical protein n=1 Tax=Shewanella hanedai TaxID=25 RepID=UPI001C8F3D4B|nr:hypothetical protein [Shewanella hanedai]
MCCATTGARDHSIQAAISAAAGGSTFASCLMEALAVGAGQLNGGQEIFHGVIKRFVHPSVWGSLFTHQMVKISIPS